MEKDFKLYSRSYRETVQKGLSVFLNVTTLNQTSISNKEDLEMWLKAHKITLNQDPLTSCFSEHSDASLSLQCMDFDLFKRM